MSYLESDFTNLDALLNPTDEEFIDWLSITYNIQLSERAPEYPKLREKFNDLFLVDLELAEKERQLSRRANGQ